MIKGFLEVAKDAVGSSLEDGDIAIDGTVGNGFDTVFLAQAVGSTGFVYGFDVQEMAIASAAKRLQKNGLNNVTLCHCGHEQVVGKIPEKFHGKVKAAMFNLGFLPRSDKNIITQAQTTVPALQGAYDVLCPGGVLSVAVYTGHEGGVEEGDAVQQWMEALDWNECRCASYTFTNKPKGREVLYLVEKLRKPRKA
ncbi:MAG: class I SAM-dependent methyltransferase [Desulfovibrio sp.]